jgi:hypothetical protein
MSSKNSYIPPPSKQKDLKRQHLAKLEQIRKLEAERAELRRRGEPVPRRLEFHLKMAEADAEELRLWGHRALVRTIHELREGAEG